MQSDQTAVTITRQGTRVTARTISPPGYKDAADASGQEHGYAHLTAPLRQRGLICTVEYGLSDYIVHAELPDLSVLIISPPQEPATDHPPGRPESWLATRSSPYDPTVQEVLYNSEPGGPNSVNGGSTAPLLASIEACLDRLGLPKRAPSAALEPFNAADAVLHRAGFVAETTHRGRFHHLPAAMTDPDEQRRAVTRAVDALRAEGVSYAVEADLVDNSLPVSAPREMSLGNRLARLTQSLPGSVHTSQAVAVLSELTAPGDGLLDRLSETLDATADWWEGLGAPADPVYADRLRVINQQMAVSVQEIKNLRNALANRHTTHPRHTHPDTPARQEPRVVAALAFSPNALRRQPAQMPTGPSATPVAPAPRPTRPR